MTAATSSPAGEVPLPTVLMRLAGTIEGTRSALHRHEEALLRATADGILDPEMVKDLQIVDEISQTMADVARLLSLCALGPVNTAGIGHALQLEAVRAAILDPSGGTVVSGTTNVELF